MYKVYCIEDINDNKYIGKTMNTLTKRFCNHKSEYRNKYGKCSSHKLNLYNSIIYIIEDNLDEKEADEKETYYINTIDCVNKITKHKDDRLYKKKYRSKEENIEIEKQGKIKWYNKNREKILEYKKQQNKKDWFCDICNCSVKLNHKSRHIKSLKHQSLN